MITVVEVIVGILLALPVAIASIFALMPILWRLVGSRNHPVHETVTSDIPGNPHVFDFSLISLLRTMPEPNNFNIVWTKVPFEEPLLVRGQLPPSRFSSCSLYAGLGAVPESLELHANKDASRGLFEITIQHPDKTHSETSAETLIVADSSVPAGMVVMRNYLVPPGTVVRTPEIVQKSSGKVIRGSEHLCAGSAVLHLQPSALPSTLAQIALYHLLVWLSVILLRGWSASSLFFNALFSVFAVALTVAARSLLFYLGKRRMAVLGQELAPEPNKLYHCDLEKSSKGSQPSKIHKYYFMRYTIPPGQELAVRGKIDRNRQEYWSLVAYDIFGLPLPHFFYDLNATLNSLTENVYEFDIRMSNESRSGRQAIGRPKISELPVHNAPEGYVLFRLVHPRDDEVVAFSHPNTQLLPLNSAEPQSQEKDKKQR
eukprot:gene4843-5310_t